MSRFVQSKHRYRLHSRNRSVDDNGLRVKSIVLYVGRGLFLQQQRCLAIGSRGASSNRDLTSSPDEDAAATIVLAGDVLQDNAIDNIMGVDPVESKVPQAQIAHDD